jgi:hypothetical protein
MWLRAIHNRFAQTAAVVLTAVLASCGSSSAPPRNDTLNGDPSGSDARAMEEAMLSESCNCCNPTLAAVDLVDAIPTDTFTITTPVAIGFFTLANRQDWFDSIDDGHQTYYRTVDQYGRYTAVMHPLLEKRGVRVIDTLIDRTVLFFEDSRNEYIVDVRKYFHNDGVLMFTPGKAPVFWTAAALSSCCDDTSFVNCYFGQPE